MSGFSLPFRGGTTDSDAPDAGIAHESARLATLAARFPATPFAWTILTLRVGRDQDPVEMRHSLCARDATALSALVVDLAARSRISSIRFETASAGLSARSLGL